jgi:phosphopantetheinyl transferase
MPATLVEAHHGIWAEMLAHLILGRRERATWRAMTGTPKRRGEWLLGRAAAKDAVRQVLRSRFGEAPSAADIEVMADGWGRPEVHGAWRERLRVSPVVSIAHSGGVAAALAALDGRLLVGLDVERIDGHRDGYEKLAFGAGEKALVSTLDDNARREWYLRMWCAKEAAGKAIGRGLAHGIGSLQVTDVRPNDGVVQVTLAGSAADAFPALRDAGLRVTTTREGDVVSSALVETS